MAKAPQRRSSKIMHNNRSPVMDPPPPSMLGEEDQIEILKDEEVLNVFTNILPPAIVTNIRKKIEPEQIDPRSLLPKKKEEDTIRNAALIWCDQTVVRKAVPKYPMRLVWRPLEMTFNILDQPIVQKLLVGNRSPKIMYVQMIGLINEVARMGAGWKCSPRTRILIAPGLEATFVVKAMPREESPVPFARVGLQLATAHCEDTFVGHFSIPIAVNFLNYIPIPSEECEAEEEKETENKENEI